MNATFALEWFQDMMWMAVIAAGPPVLTAVIVGLIMAILQAATQINDQAVAFGPKAIAMIIALVASSHWVVGRISDFTINAFEAMAQLGPNQ